MFFIDHHFPFSDRLLDDEFLRRLTYQGDVFSRLNDLNLGLQGLSATIFKVLDKIEAMTNKLELFLTTHRSIHCMIFLCVNKLKLTDNVKCVSSISESTSLYHI